MENSLSLAVWMATPTPPPPLTTQNECSPIILYAESPPGSGPVLTVRAWQYLLKTEMTKYLWFNGFILKMKKNSRYMGHNFGTSMAVPESEGSGFMIWLKEGWGSPWTSRMKVQRQDEMKGYIVYFQKPQTELCGTKNYLILVPIYFRQELNLILKSFY